MPNEHFKNCVVEGDREGEPEQEAPSVGDGVERVELWGRTVPPTLDGLLAAVYADVGDETAPFKRAIDDGTKVILQAAVQGEISKDSARVIGVMLSVARDKHVHAWEMNTRHAFRDSGADGAARKLATEGLDKRSLILDRAIALLRVTPTDTLFGYLPVLQEAASVSVPELTAEGKVA